MRMSLGLSLNRRRAGAAGADFTLSQTTDGELEIDGATGDVTVTITSPAAYAGTYVFASADLATGPVNLVPPVIIDDGTPASGETLTLTPGLWVYDPDVNAVGSPTYQWQADAAGDANFTNIGGATASSYTLTSGESGDDVRVVETLAYTPSGGSRSANSTAVSVAAPIGGDVATHMGAQFTHTAGNTTSVTRTLTVSGYTAGEKIVIFYNGGIAAYTITAAGGTPTTVTTWDFGSGRRGGVYTHTLSAGDISTGTIDVVVSSATSPAWAFDFLHTAGSVATFQVDSNDSPISVSVTPTAADNTLFHFIAGDRTRFETTGAVYTAGITARLYNEVGASGQGIAAGIMQDVAVSAQTVTLTTPGSGNFVHVAVVVE